MATISLNESAPAEELTFYFANLEPFTLSPGESLDTDDPALAAAVLESPWLTVEGTVSEPEVDEPEQADEPEAEQADTFNRGFFAAGDDA